MALSFDHGSIQWLNSHTVGHDYVVSGLGFVPKALRLYWTGINSAVDATNDTSNLNRGMGFATGTSARRCVSTFNSNGADLPDCGTIARNDCVACTVAGDGTGGGRVDLESFDGDGFTLTVDAETILASLTLFWEAWGGDDITVATVGDIVEPSAIGTQDYVVTDFEADATDQVVMIAGCQSVSSLNTGEGQSTGFCAGFAVSDTEQAVVAGNSDDGSATTDTDHYDHSGECLAMIAIGGGSANARAALTAFGTNLFTLDWLARNNSNRRYIFMAIKGGQWRAGSYVLDATVLNNTATVSGLPFEPVGITFIAGLAGENAAGSGGTNDGMTFGSVSGAASRSSVTIRDVNAVADVEIYHAVQYDQARIAISTAGVLSSTHDIDSINADGFTMIVDLADAAAVTPQWTGYLTFGDAEIGGSTVTPHSRYYEMMRTA